MARRQSTVCIDCGAPSDDGLELNPTGLWCRVHELERRERISSQLDELSKRFGLPVASSLSRGGGADA